MTVPDTENSDYTAIFDARGHLYNEAGSNCPQARELERAALLDLMGDCTGKRVVDIPAGGGYLADGLREKFGKAVEIICIEPSERFSASINPGFEARNDSIGSLSLEDSSVDVIASLAGLHHAGSIKEIFSEWLRVLKPGGILVVADVMANTGPDGFLNQFVNAHTPGGHDGSFFKPGELTHLMSDVGLINVSEQLVEVPWQFPNSETMDRFCKTLFATLHADETQVRAGIEKHLGWNTTAEGVAMNWCLVYASGTRP